MYLQSDTKTFDFSSLGVKFDVILLEPPLEEYQRRASGVTFSWSPWDWEEVSKAGRGRGGRKVSGKSDFIIPIYKHAYMYISAHVQEYYFFYSLS